MGKTSSRYLTLAGLLAVALMTPGLAGAAAAIPDDAASVPSDDASRGLVYDDLLPDRHNVCRGMLRVKSGGCTHGPDAPPPGMNVKQPVAPIATVAPAAAAECIGDGVSGNRVQVMYIHPPGRDRYAQYLASFKQWSLDMDTIYNESAKETGGLRRIRFVHDASCMPIVLNIEISATALSGFGSTMTALRNMGYNRVDRSYTLLGDSTVYCGIGMFDNDDRKIANNASNFGPSFARSDSGCWGGHTMAHELGHNLGAVAYSAPNTSRGAHCTDERDVMCYSDSPYYPPMRIICPETSHENRLDCRHDDYYHTNPPAGNYLATHFNVADNVFLFTPGGQPPTRVGPIVGVGSGRCVDVPSTTNLTALQLFDCNGSDRQRWTIETDGTIRAQGKCMEVRSGSSADGTVVDINTCNGSTAQKWTYDGTTRNVRALGKCLDAYGAGTANGTKLIIWTCHTGSNQKWTLPS